MNEIISTEKNLTQDSGANSDEFIDDVFGGACTGTNICVCTRSCCITRWLMADGSEGSDDGAY
jgi:hypothetical protein